MTTPEPREDHELAACPFCGNENVRVVTNTMAAMSWVACPDCGLETPTETGTSAADAVAYWNRRPSAVSEEAVERVSAAIEDLIPWSPGTESRRGFPSTDAIARAAIAALSPTTPAAAANTGRAEVLEEAARVAEDKTLVVSPYGDMTQRKIAAAIRALKSTPTDATAVEEERP